MKIPGPLQSIALSGALLGVAACDRVHKGTVDGVEAALAAAPITMSAEAYNGALQYYSDRQDLKKVPNERFGALVETRANLDSARQELVDGKRPLFVFLNNLKASDKSGITKEGATELKINVDYGNWRTMSCRSDGTIVFQGGQNTNHQYLADCTVMSAVMDGGTLVVTIDGNLSEGVGGPRKDQLSASTKTVPMGAKTLTISAGVYMVENDALASQNPNTP